MLAALHIHNVVLIERATIDFRDGLCALTGETGAGKSILLDSLGLALGGRSDSALIRKGAEQAQVTAEFELPAAHPAFALLRAQDVVAQTPLVLRRSINPDGRSRAFINDQPVSIALLKSVGETLVGIHGQFDTHGLYETARHREMLDDYAALGEGVSALWGAWAAAAEELNRLRETAERARGEEDFLRGALQDLDTLGVQEGEEERLSGLKERLLHREKALEAMGQAYALLSEGEDPAQRAAQILSRARGKIGEDADAILAALDRAGAEVQEAVGLLQSLSADLSETEFDLEEIDERLHALRTQARKHRCTVAELPAKRREIADALQLIDHADAALALAVKAAEKARRAFVTAAEQLRTARGAAAQRLDALVQQELAPLKLDKARFVTRIEPLAEPLWGPHGMDKVQFLVATNPGAEPGPLSKIASGGEMARFMLALKVVMAEVGTAYSLIFDEVDTGIGGAVADAVGERLAQLAARKQILVVTHAPQVAARAGHHWIVRKTSGAETRTQVVLLSPAERQEEIARMLAGATVTEEARAAAGKLLELGRAA